MEMSDLIHVLSIEKSLADIEIQVSSWFWMYIRRSSMYEKAEF